MIILEDKNIKKYGRIYDFLFRRIISQGSFIHSCNSCNNVLYLLDTTTDDIKRIDKDPYVFINDVVTIYLFNNTIEIYIVRHSPEIQKYIRFLQYDKKYKDKNMVIAINLNDLEFEKTIDDVVGMGFCNPQIAEKYSDKFPLKSPVLFLVNTCGIRKTKSSIKQIAKKMRVDYLKNTDRYIFKIDDLKYIYSLLSENVEYGGEFTPTDLEKTHFLALNKDTIAKGNEKTQTIKMQVYPYSFHTHPEKFYRHTDNKAFAGWFSAMDINYLINNHMDGMKTHFLFTPEGMYSLSLRDDFIDYYSKLTYRQKNVVSDTLMDIFIQQERNRKVVNKKDLVSINQNTIFKFVDFFKLVNTISSNSLPDEVLTKKDKTDPFLLFNMDFAYKDDLMNYYLKF